jgi:hypothetical protein
MVSGPTCSARRCGAFVSGYLTKGPRRDIGYLETAFSLAGKPIQNIGDATDCIATACFDRWISGLGRVRPFVSGRRSRSPAVTRATMLE